MNLVMAFSLSKGSSHQIEFLHEPLNDSKCYFRSMVLVLDRLYGTSSLHQDLAY